MMGATPTPERGLDKESLNFLFKTFENVDNEVIEAGKHFWLVTNLFSVALAR